jgi:hypothetical protein
VFFFKKKYYVGMAQKKRVSEGQYSKKMLSIIDLLIFNTLMDSFMGRFISTGISVASTNKADLHDITYILRKVVLSSINQTNQPEAYMFTLHCENILQ